MRYGAHLPLIDLDGQGWDRTGLADYARLASSLGYDCLAANDHLVFARPWLDAVVALASVVEASGAMRLATTVALPVVRGPAALAKAAAALDLLSGGRLVLGLGPGSSTADYALAGIDPEERWGRFEAAVDAVRSHLGVTPATSPQARFYPDARVLEPLPHRPGGPPVWVGSWGSPAGLRRVARLGEGWLASAYHTTPELLAAGAATLRELRGEPMSCALATAWTLVTDDDRERDAALERLSTLLGRPADELADRLPIGSVQRCAEVAGAYAEAGVDLLLLWPVAEPQRQLERFMLDVVPRVGTASAP